jgi:hypothetical protein
LKGLEKVVLGKIKSCKLLQGAVKQAVVLRKIRNRIYSFIRNPGRLMSVSSPSFFLNLNRMDLILLSDLNVMDSISFVDRFNLRSAAILISVGVRSLL